MKKKRFYDEFKDDSAPDKNPRYTPGKDMLLVYWSFNHFDDNHHSLLNLNLDHWYTGVSENIAWRRSYSECDMIWIMGPIFIV